ncbi:MAG: hypothetical protein ABIA83_02430 [Patescibacteria group bacterium]
MRQLSDKGVLTLLSTIGNNLDLDGLDPEKVQTAIRAPAETGLAFSAWVNAGCPMMRPTEPIRPWYEKDGIIYLSSPLIADGTTGADWITRLKGAGKSVSRYAKSVLRSRDFVPSPAGTLYKVAILKGSLFEDSARITANICAKATELGFTKLHAEVACLIRWMFTDDDIKAMDLWWIVAMHDPIEDSAGSPNLLGANRHGFGFSLDADCVGPAGRWDGERGFAFQQV